MCHDAQLAQSDTSSAMGISSSLQVNKEDLLNMVRYGAELVFSSEAANITDAGG
jgi:hypothetical protein